jgi:hypothetical protein
VAMEDEERGCKKQKRHRSADVREKTTPIQ